MAQIREIKKRIVAVGTIQRITKTMQMIATVKFTTAMQRAKSAKPYAERVQQLVAEVVNASGDLESPLVNPPLESPNRELLLVIGSDRGFCGAFNGNNFRQSLAQISAVKSSGSTVALETSGKKAPAFFRFQGVDVAEHHSLGDAPRYEEVAQLADRYISEFSDGAYDAVRVAYMRYLSNSRQAPEIVQLLPLQAASDADETQPDSTTGGGDPSATYEFSPSADDLLDDLLPLSIKTTLFQAFLDAAVSEQIMRMVAMKAATENAKEVGRLLKRSYNRARQTKITTELMEVISGAAALE